MTDFQQDSSREIWMGDGCRPRFQILTALSFSQKFRTRLGLQYMTCMIGGQSTCCTWQTESQIYIRFACVVPSLLVS
jgi:hypothetical protein